ncbi:hypothetical protein K6327_000895 [Vibrio vulnificus]|nr:hypothetical protein [Vibrio vulnificus]
MPKAPFPLMPADFLRERHSVYKFMDTKELLKEVDVFFKAAKKIAPKATSQSLNSRPSLEDVMVLRHIIIKACPFAKPPTASQLYQRLSSYPWLAQESQIVLLLLCLTKVKQALLHLSENNELSDFAVPSVWHRRWEDLILGDLYPAYVASYTAYRYLS